MFPASPFIPSSPGRNPHGFTFALTRRCAARRTASVSYRRRHVIGPPFLFHLTAEHIGDVQIEDGAHAESIVEGDRRYGPQTETARYPALGLADDLGQEGLCPATTREFRTNLACEVLRPGQRTDWLCFHTRQI